MTETNAAPGSNLWRNLAIAALGLLVLFSLHLAINRIFQVDEAQNVYMSRVVATGESGRYFTNGSFFLLGPLSWIAGHTSSSVAMYTWDRILFLAVFWVNILLIALGTGAKAGSRTFLYATLAAATLAPVWDYGFEIRHDNILLLILLSAWWTLRRSGAKAEVAYFFIGFLSGIMQFVAFKAFLYWLPLSGAALLFPPPNHQQASRIRIAAAWVGGLAVSAVLAFIAYKATGTWDAFLNGFRTSVGHSESPDRFGPWLALSRLPSQIPLLTGMAAGLVLMAGRALAREKKGAMTWSGPWPEAVLCLSTFLILLVNPVPYPYNLVLVVPFMFLAAWAWAPRLTGILSGNVAMASLAASIVLFAHAVPFAVQTARHLDMPNTRQEQLMDLAESMTDPAADPVYDAAGLVPTRQSIHFQWFLHSLVMPKIASGQLPTVRAMLAANPPAVIMPNYRLDWLGEDDRAYIAQHYLPLADDFFVLGAALPEGAGGFDCIHAGRYAIVSPSASGLERPSGSVTVDGQTVAQDGILQLGLGKHDIKPPAGQKVAIVWIGPSLRQLQLPGAADHRALFANWY